MGRAFDTWAQNHPDISFRDVTRMCEAAGELRPGASSCSYAEIWVTSLSHDDSSSTASMQGDAMALATPKFHLSNNFRYTNGETPKLSVGSLVLPRQVVEVTGGTIAFTDAECWYLDSYFCSGWHDLKRGSSPDVVFGVGLFLLFGTWSVAMLFTIWLFAKAVREQLRLRFEALRDLDGNGSVEASEVAKQLAERTYWRTQAFIAAFASESIVGTSLRWTLLLLPWGFYEAIFVTCWSCYDFEAAAAHEVGHLLGLGHPDTVGTEMQPGYSHLAPLINNSFNALLASGASLNASTCLTPWDHVHAGVPGVSSGAGSRRPALMSSSTQHNPSVCLYEDDYEALLTLYPVCTPMPPAPVCLKSDLNIGAIRCFAFVLGPAFLALLISIAVHFCLDAKDPHRLRRLSIAIRESRLLTPSSRTSTPRGSTPRAGSTRIVPHQSHQSPPIEPAPIAPISKVKPPNGTPSPVKSSLQSSRVEPAVKTSLQSSVQSSRVEQPPPSKPPPPALTAAGAIGE